MTPIEEIKEKTALLQQQLLSAHPQLPVLLREIHNKLRADPETVTLMSEEDIGIIVSGLKRQTQVEISTAAVKNSGKTKSLKNISVDDL